MRENTAKSGAPELDIPTFSVPGKEEFTHSTDAKTNRRIRSTKQPKIEVIRIPTRFDPDVMKVVVDILEDWIIADIDKGIGQVLNSCGE